MAKLFILVLVTLALAVSHAAIPEHLITSLPGYNGSFPSKQYSGYINVDATNGRYLHYWFVESESQPASDPVVLWMNGGPGCSSLDGYFYEHGPLHFQDDQLSADGVPALKLNPDRWNKIANVIFLEAPAGVGFSYSETPGDYNTNDNKTAADNFAFLQGFFKAYPEYAQNRFFVSGESYAGIYVPTLVEQIMIHNDKGDSNINLEGFLVGNGCIGNAVGACGADGTRIAVDFLYGHALYSTDLHKQILANCPDLTNPSDACSSLLDQMSNDVGNVNVYNIYADCISGGLRKAHRMGWTNATTTDVVMNSRDRRIPSRPVDELVGGPVGCIDGISAGAYLNNDAVRAAIHVLPMSQLPSWSICSSSIGYSSTIDSLLGLYPTLIKRYRVLIYNGDVDACVPYLQDEEWTSSLGYSVVAPWHPWSLNNQVAGYATIFSENNFTFITVKGSGHMVPQYRPPQAFEMLNRFLNKQPF